MTAAPAQLVLITCALAVGEQGHGQVGGEATWLWEVTTQNGDAVVESGETATITLSIDCEPDTAQTGPVLGLGHEVWDTLGGMNAGLGQIAGWDVPGELTSLTGDLTTTDGISLFGTTVRQLPIGPFIHDDPVEVLTFEWATSRYSEYTVEYMTSTYLEDFGDHVIFVWEGSSVFEAEGFIWPIEETTISFQVVVCGRRRRA